MRRLLIFYLVASVCGILGPMVEAKDENSFLLLDEKTFSNALQEADIFLVLFSSDNCRNCSAMESVLSASAKLLAEVSKNSSMRIGLGRVDVAASPSLALQHGATVDMTDTVLKLFKNQTSLPAVDYTGPVDSAEAVAEHLRTVAAEVADSEPHRLTEAGLAEALTRHANWLVAFADVSSASSLQYALDGLRAAASELRPRNRVAIGFADALGDEKAMAQRLGLSLDRLPVFALLRRDEPNWAIQYSHPLSRANLAKFYRAHASQSGASFHVEAARVFDSTAPLDALNSGMEAHLVASAEAAEPIKRFLAVFLAESGYFYERRLNGGLLTGPVAQQLGMTADAIYVRLSQNLLSSGESGIAHYPGPLHSTPALKAFYDLRSLPRLGLLAWHNRRVYMSARRPVCLFFTSLPSSWRGEAGNLARLTHARLAAMIEGRQDMALFALADEDSVEPTESRRFGFDESSSEVNLGCYDTARRRFAMPESDGPDPAAVRRFLDSFAAGTAPQHIRSASVPIATNGKQQPRVFTANADRLKQLLADASSVVDSRLLLLQCDFSMQPCAQSIKQFDEAASLSAGAVTFVRVDTKFNDLPGELYYRFEGESAIELTSKEPQVALLLPPRGSESPRVIRYQREVVSKAYLLQFLADSLQQEAKHMEL